MTLRKRDIRGYITFMIGQILTLRDVISHSKKCVKEDEDYIFLAYAPNMDNWHSDCATQTPSWVISALWWNDSITKFIPAFWLLLWRTTVREFCRIAVNTLHDPTNRDRKDIYYAVAKAPSLRHYIYSPFWCGMYRYKLNVPCWSN